MSMSSPLVVWDFDWSLVNENSDTYVIERLDPSGRIWADAEKKLRRGTEWTPLMDWALGQLHDAGHTLQALSDALVTIPVLDGALAAVTAARAAGAEQRILSDANDMYIASILESRGIANIFSVVETNPTSSGADGRLRVRPHQPDAAPHGCPHCPPNLCKGAVLERWLSELSPCRCVYVGDGSGDYCPATRLRAGDVVLARQSPHDSLLALCRKRPDTIAATVLEWGSLADRGGVALSKGMTTALEGLPTATTQ